MEKVGRRFSWASLPLIATVARLLHRDLVLQVEYLRVQYDVVRSRIRGRIRFTFEERRPLVGAALAMGRRAMRAAARAAGSAPLILGDEFSYRTGERLGEAEEPAVL